MGWLTKQAWVRVAIAASLALTVSRQAWGEDTPGKSPSDLIVEAVKSLDPEGQERAIKEALGRLGMTPSPILDVCRDTLSGYLMNELRTHGVRSLEELKDKARAQCASIVRVQLNNPAATLSDADARFASDLAKEAFNKQVPAPRILPNGSLITRASGFRSAADTNPPQDGGAQSPPPSTGTGATIPPVIQGAVADKLKVALIEMDAIIAVTLCNNLKRVPTADERATELMKWVRNPPEPGFEQMSFPTQLSKIANQNITSFTQLSPKDQDALDALIKSVVGQQPTKIQELQPVNQTPVNQTPAKSDADKPTDQNAAVSAAEEAVGIAGQIFPQFAPFEGLADEGIEFGVPLLQRWRQRCLTGQPLFGANRVLFPALAPRSRYIIVNP